MAHRALPSVAAGVLSFTLLLPAIAHLLNQKHLDYATKTVDSRGQEAPQTLRPGPWRIVAELITSPRYRQKTCSRKTFLNECMLRGLTARPFDATANDLQKLQLPVVVFWKDKEGAKSGLAVGRMQKDFLLFTSLGRTKWISINTLNANGVTRGVLFDGMSPPPGLWYPLNEYYIGTISPKSPKYIDLWIPSYCSEIAINDVSVDCGCVSVLHYSQSIPRNSFAHLRLSVDASADKFHGGHFRQGLTISYSSNPGNIPSDHRVEIVGKIEQKARAITSTADLGRIPANALTDPKMVMFRIEDPSEQIADVRPVDFPLGVKWGSWKRMTGVICVSLSVVPAALTNGRTGSIAQELKLVLVRQKGSKVPNSTISVGIVGEQESKLRVFPAVLSLGVQPVGARIHRNLYVAYSQDNKYEILANPASNFQIDQSGKTVRLDVVMPRNAGFFRGGVLITTSEGSRYIPVLAAVVE